MNPPHMIETDYDRIYSYPEALYDHETLELNEKNAKVKTEKEEANARNFLNSLSSQIQECAFTNLRMSPIVNDDNENQSILKSKTKIFPSTKLASFLPREWQRLPRRDPNAHDDSDDAILFVQKILTLPKGALRSEPIDIDKFMLKSQNKLKLENIDLRHV